MTAKMSYNEVKDLSKVAVNELLEKIDREKVHSDLNQKLEIHSDDSDSSPHRILKTHDAELYQTILYLSISARQRQDLFGWTTLRTWSTYRQISRRLHKIWSALKTPKTTFRRLKDKWSKYNEINSWINQKRRMNWKLSTV